MELGKVVKPERLAGGRILLRRTNEGDTLAITTDVATGDDNERVSILFSESEGDTLIYTSDLTDDFWDVTEISELRPTLASHMFTSGTVAHGTLYLGQDGLLHIVGMLDPVRKPRAFKRVFVENGLEVPGERQAWLSFPEWRLVALKAGGKDGETLFKWPRPASPQPSVREL